VPLPPHAAAMAKMAISRGAKNKRNFMAGNLLFAPDGRSHAMIFCAWAGWVSKVGVSRKLASLCAGWQAPEPRRDCVFLGELSLDGRVRHTGGMLPMVGIARERGLTTAFVPEADAAVVVAVVAA